MNDITREPIIAPFTFSIQKSKEKLKADIDEKKKLVPYVFNRDDSKVKSKTKDIDEFFSLVEKIIKANWSLEDSKNLVYERRYHKQYEKARSQFISDSSALSIYLDTFTENIHFLKKINYGKDIYLEKKIIVLLKS